MIISFSVTNWMSFRDRVTLSMVASRERQHGERVARLGRYQMRVLPIMALYGGNASGKTNLFKALSFAKTQIIEGSQPGDRIPVIPFRLDRDCAAQPSRFEFELLIDGSVYALSFAVTREKVLEERLVKVGSTSERILYDRRHGDIEFDGSLVKEEQFLKFTFRGTRDNQFFLTNSISQNVSTFRPIYDWFKDTLRMISPDTRLVHGVSFYENRDLAVKLNEMFTDLDTGISRMASKSVPFESIPIPEQMKNHIRGQLDEGEGAYVEGPVDTYSIDRRDGDLIARKRMTVHRMTDGRETYFDISQESDGSRRLIDLLPAFLDLSSGDSKQVYVIDEVDRSLHTLLTRRLLEHYLAACTAETRTQLLLTTHDVLLMDQRSLRRDEMWVTERDASGASSLLSFSEYRDVRYDKDIRKSYLQGRLGGIPRITPTESVRFGAG